jgi:uncharacterized protein YbcC (UPF0753/DUF2309 family)
MRLLAVVHAAPEAVEDILRRREDVARLVLGEWIELVVADPASGDLLRRDPAAGWVPVGDLVGEVLAIEGEEATTLA